MLLSSNEIVLDSVTKAVDFNISEQVAWQKRGKHFTSTNNEPEHWEKNTSSDVKTSKSINECYRHFTASAHQVRTRIYLFEILMDVFSCNEIFIAVSSVVLYGC